MYFKLPSNMALDGKLLLKGTFVRDIDLAPHLAEKWMGVDKVEKIEDADFRAMESGDVYVAPAPQEVPIESNPIDEILSGTVNSIAQHVADVDDVEFLSELAIAEADGKGRKGVLNAIDDRISEVVDRDPTPAENPVHIIDDTFVREAPEE